MAKQTFRFGGAIVGLAFFAALGTSETRGHHGWGAYDTDAPLLIEGQVTQVRWRNPHPELVIEVTGAVTVDPGRVPVPGELSEFGFAEVVAKARPAQPGRYTLDLAPIGRLQSWGMQAAPREGERLVAVAFPSCSQAGTVRPALVVLPDGTAVRQQSVRLPRGCSGAPRG